MDPKEEIIAELAYQLWEERGCPQGSAEVDWFEARRRVAAAESSVVDSFPASDPPATHGVDRRPSNADAKWQTARAQRQA
jgi:hypothetical protein